LTPFNPGYYLYLPAPTKLVGSSTVDSPVVQVAALEFLDLVPLAPSEKANHEQLLADLNQRLTSIRNKLAPFLASVAPAESCIGLSDKQLRYAAHFHAKYVEGTTADLLVAAVITAFCNFYQDQLQGTTLLPLEVAHLFAAAQRIINLFAVKGEDHCETIK